MLPKLARKEINFWGGYGLSQVVCYSNCCAQRACGGSQGRLRAARAQTVAALQPTLFNPCRSPLMPNLQSNLQERCKIKDSQNEKGPCKQRPFD